MLWFVFNGAGAILMSLRCWAVAARVMRRFIFFGDSVTGTFVSVGSDVLAGVSGVSGVTAADISECFCGDGVAGAIIGNTVCLVLTFELVIRSNSVMANWIAFSSCAFNCRLLQLWKIVDKNIQIRLFIIQSFFRVWLTLHHTHTHKYTYTQRKTITKLNMDWHIIANPTKTRTIMQYFFLVYGCSTLWYSSTNANNLR